MSKPIDPTFDLRDPDVRVRLLRKLTLQTMSDAVNADPPLSAVELLETIAECSKAFARVAKLCGEKIPTRKRRRPQKARK